MLIITLSSMLLFLQTMAVVKIFSAGEYTERKANRFYRAVIISLYIGIIGYAVLSVIAVPLCKTFRISDYDFNEYIVYAIVLIINVPLWICGGVSEIADRKVLIIIYHIFFAILIFVTVIGMVLYPPIGYVSANNSEISSALRADTSSYYVYVTESGKKYHRSNCRYVKDKDTKRYTVGAAESAGYSPCSVCNP